MNRITRHPLRIQADALARAMVLQGFRPMDHGDQPHIMPSDMIFDTMQTLTADAPKVIRLLDGQYALRTSMIPSQLIALDGTLPIRTISIGFVFDGRDVLLPNHLAGEGIIADQTVTIQDLQVLWTAIARTIYGINASAVLTASESDTLTIEIHQGEDCFTIGSVGKATTLVRTLLRLQDPATADVWTYRIDIEAMTLQAYAMSDRTAIYDNRISNIGACASDAAAYGSDSLAKATDILRRLGYAEFIGEKFTTDDAYVRMNMIQDAWDTNNVGVQLTQPLPGYHNPLTDCTELTGLPTVLTPALEQAMADNYSAGEPTVKLFEISHIYKPKAGRAPSEKVSISFGAYGKDLRLADFKKDIDAFLMEFGIQNHFFIPTDVAIAYKKGQCLLILDEKMQYLDANGGHIAEKALANFRIDSDGFMAQFELPTLERKADQEYHFTAPEYQ